tara:strand:- start:17821 stop:19848 length:2028 start_codon:yes stop_codon:yes gene_type:complete
MNTRFFIPIFLLLFSLGFSQSRDTFCLKLYKMNVLLQKNHYAPKAINNTMSEYVYSTFINLLDPDELIFMQHEVDSLSKYKLLMDDAVFNTECDFLNDFISTYKGGLERQLHLLDELEKEVFQPELADSLRRKEKGVYYDTADEIKNVFRKRLAYSVLDKFARTATNKDSLYSRLPLVAEEMSKIEIENLRCTIENQLNPNNGLDTYILDLFANVFSGYFDPHSNYFNTDAKNDFFNSLTSGTLSFGLIMEQDDSNEVNVYDILTGSPAFRDTRIEKGDRLIRVQHKEKTYEVNCVNMNVVNTMFYSDTYKNLLLTFRKKNGVDFETRLQKEMLKNYENSVFSFIIEGNKKLGYINVPTFYSNLEGNTTNVYNDFFFELNHLKSEGAKGFIIDLQNNSGGDMTQALYMISLFLDSGPITLLKHRQNQYNLVYNFFEKKHFKEPMVVLVNGYTGSASELFAAAMQDHKRAVLLGQQSYGKGTLQTFFPLDDENPEGELLKVTIEKMFRLDGKSHQLTGVEPDIVTPALLEPLFYKESDYARALEVEDLGEVFKLKRKFPSSYRKAIASGQERIAMRPHYSEVTAFNKSIEKQMAEKRVFPINFEAVFQAIEKENQLFTGFYTLYETTYPLQLRVLEKDEKTMNYDPLLQPMVEANKQRVLTNPDVLEAAYVLLDLL